MNAASALLTSKSGMLRRGLLEVQAALRAVQEQRAVLSEHFKRDETLIQTVLLIQQEQLNAFTALRLQSDDVEYIAAVRRALQGIRDALDSLNNSLDRNKKDFEPLATLRWVSPEVVESAIQGTSDRVAAALESLDALDGAAAEALMLHVNGDEGRARVKFQAAWISLAAVDLESREIFREYVDLLAGIALRDTGYDQGIGRLADHLMGDWRYRRWSGESFAVPTHEETKKASLAGLLRIGFPEWSIWALPLVAHEYARVLMDEGGALEPLAAKYRRVNGSPVLLADIFATRVMGPAYAAALLFLRLDPMAAIADNKQLHIRRAFVIRKSLESLEERDAMHLMGGMRKQLTDGWNSVMSQIGQGPAADPADDATLDMLKSMAKAMEATNEFPTSRWDVVQHWSEALTDSVRARADGENTPTSWDVGADLELRLALNAGWRARLNSEANDLDSLTVVTKQLIDDVYKKAHAKGGQQQQTYGQQTAPGQSGDGLRRGVPPSAPTFQQRQSTS